MAVYGNCLIKCTQMSTSVSSDLMPLYKSVIIIIILFFLVLLLLFFDDALGYYYYYLATANNIILANSESCFISQKLCCSLILWIFEKTVI